ncbi:hypothetical protein NMY22_g282 [Coprinellus aureogranulatus]|nr:hypothetical protein NMY22_g282 [Coprinellus aureogranulatus]
MAPSLNQSRQQPTEEKTNILFISMARLVDVALPRIGNLAPAITWPFMLQAALIQVLSLSVLVLLCSVLPVSAQQDTLVYLPCAWDDFNNAPILATNLGVDSATSQTTWGLYERPFDREVGPGAWLYSLSNQIPANPIPHSKATLIHGPAPSQAIVIYAAPIRDGIPPQFVTGECSIATPVAVCSVTVDVPTGQVTIGPSQAGTTTFVEGAPRETETARNKASRGLGLVNQTWMVLVSRSWRDYAKQGDALLNPGNVKTLIDDASALAQGLCDCPHLGPQLQRWIWSLRLLETLLDAMSSGPVRSSVVAGSISGVGKPIRAHIGAPSRVFQPILVRLDSFSNVRFWVAVTDLCFKSSIAQLWRFSFSPAVLLG